MDRQEALRVLISARHHCFVQGVLGEEDGFRQAFRTLNRLYVKLRDEIKRGDKITRKVGGRPRKYKTAAERCRVERNQGKERQKAFRLRGSSTSRLSVTENPSVTY